METQYAFATYMAEKEKEKKTLNLSLKVHDILNWTEGKGVRLTKVYEVDENF